MPEPVPPIADHAIVGDCASAALVTSSGTIDWLCWPRFDSDPVFAALLDPEAGGHWRIAPTAEAETSRRYVPDTAVLETTFRTGTGELTLTDAMLVDPDPDYDRHIHPEHELVRILRCTAGEVEVGIEFAPRFDWGRRRPRIEHRPHVGYVVSHGREVLALRCEVDLHEDEGSLVGTTTLREGDVRRCTVAYDVEEPAVLPLVDGAADRALERTIAYWEDWAGRCSYEGPHRDLVVRSAITVKLLTYSPSGAIVAAATTSLPEVPGGTSNWDYRYCWLRDSALSLRALFELGYVDEGRAFFDWLLYAARQHDGHLPIMFDLQGGAHVPESTLDHLAGYRGATPVRKGNAAAGQFQLDVFGELIAAGYEYLEQGEMLDDAQKEVLVSLGHGIVDRWRDPDNGIWELRGQGRHHTYSKAMCWVGLQRLLDLRDDGHLRDLPTERFSRVRDEIREEVERDGWNDELGTYTATCGGDVVDASLLLMSVYGYVDGADERMTGTLDAVVERLARGALVYRFLDDDGGDPDEGAFGICSFWVEEAMALAGRQDEAREHFDTMCGYASDVGLFSEEIDVATGDHLGNTPQAFTHVGLINAALTLHRTADDEERS